MQLIARPAQPDEAEKQTQKAIPKRTVDYCGTFVKLLQARLTSRTPWDAAAMQPTMAAALDLLPPEGYPFTPASSLACKFVHTSQNRVRCSVNAVAWQPDGRRCLSGAQTGEITLWRGSDFSFESVLQAHEAPLRAVVYTHNGNYLLMGDDAGTLKIFKRNLQPLREILAHRESLRAVSVGPTDLKFCTCSDDSTIKVWDMYSCEVESTLTGHGGDVRHVQWHPTSSLLASASKDALVKLWDARAAGEALATLHGHKGAVMQALWNQNGNWLLSVSRDQTLKVWDVRTLKELHTLQGHSRDVLCADWHPVHEQVCVSGAFDGTLCHWIVGQAEPQASVSGAHDGSVWGLAYHPLGHVLASAGGDASVRFWCRQRPGDPWQDAQLKEQQEGATSYASGASDAPGLRPPMQHAMPPGLGGGMPGPGAPPGGGGGGGIPGLGALGDASMPLPANVTAAGRAMPPGLATARSLPAGRPGAARPAAGRGAGPGMPPGGRGAPAAGGRGGGPGFGGQGPPGGLKRPRDEPGGSPFPGGPRPPPFGGAPPPQQFAPHAPPRGAPGPGPGSGGGFGGPPQFLPGPPSGTPPYGAPFGGPPPQQRPSPQHPGFSPHHAQQHGGPPGLPGPPGPAPGPGGFPGPPQFGGGGGGFPPQGPPFGGGPPLQHMGGPPQHMGGPPPFGPGPPQMGGPPPAHMGGPPPYMGDGGRGGGRGGGGRGRGRGRY